MTRMPAKNGGSLAHWLRTPFGNQTVQVGFLAPPSPLGGCQQCLGEKHQHPFMLGCTETGKRGGSLALIDQRKVTLLLGTHFFFPMETRTKITA